MSQEQNTTSTLVSSLKNLETALNKSCKQGVFNLNEATQLHNDLLFISQTIQKFIQLSNQNNNKQDNKQDNNIKVTKNPT